jgi:hypothetical protein
MNENLIDFPIGEKSGGLLQDLAFLSKDLILLTQAGELLANILMRTFKQIALLVLGTPPAQRRFGYAEIICNPLDAASAGQRQPHLLPFELVRKSSLFVPAHRNLRYLGMALHFCRASPRSRLRLSKSSGKLSIGDVTLASGAQIVRFVTSESAR